LRAVVPSSEALLAELHLVAVCIVTLLLHLGVVGLPLAASGASLADAGE
jgi:hypothetical protein